MGPLKSYLNNTSSLSYAYLASLPLFVIYELMMWLARLGSNSNTEIRISADIWIQQLLFMMHHNTLLLSTLLVLVLGGLIWYKERDKPIVFKPGWFVMMLLESAGWAVILAVLVSGLLSWLFYLVGQLGPAAASLLMMAESNGLNSFQRIGLSVGAGLYEELVFRVLLVYGLFYAFIKIMRPHRAQLAAILLAAFLFSLAHYIGSMGDVFTLSSFLFRMVFGLALNLLLWVRGFGITAWTHAIYNILVMFS